MTEEEITFFNKYKTLKKKNSLLVKSKPKKFDSADYFTEADKAKKKKK